MAPRHNVFSDCVWIPGTGRGPEQSTIWVHTPKTGQFRVFHTTSVEPDRSVCSSILQPNTCGISPDPSSYPLFPPRSRRLIQSYKFTCNPQQSMKSQHNRRTVGPENIEQVYRGTRETSRPNCSPIVSGFQGRFRIAAGFKTGPRQTLKHAELGHRR